MSSQKPENIRKFRRRIHINLGVIVFALVLIYFAVHLFLFLGHRNVKSYEVQYGQITEDITHTGLALRKESVADADTSGNVNYYMKQGDRAAAGNEICSIDRTGTLYSKIRKAGTDTSKLSDEDLEDIQSSISSFRSAYSRNSFDSVYNFKNSIDSMIQEDLYRSALKEYSSETSQAEENNTFTFEKAKDSGIIVYLSDGYENLTADNFKAKNYSPSTYKVTNLHNNAKVSKGDPIYKLVTDEDWTIVVPITEEERSEYKDLSVIQVSFRQDGKTQNVSFNIKKLSGNYYMFLNLNSSMVRYIADRYIDISLNINTNSGLKIPNSSITEIKCLAIPKSFMTKGGSSGSNGVLKMNASSSKSSFTNVEIVSETTNYYLIKETDDIKAGDEIIKPASSTKYTIERDRNITGVYNINRGYAVFRYVNVLSKNEDYAIVENGNDYSIDMYDRIALDADSVKDGELIN